VAPKTRTTWVGFPGLAPQSLAYLDSREVLARRRRPGLLSNGARPSIHHLRAAACWQPKMRGFTAMVSSAFNGWRTEDVWLDN
jgi:hypothetical protein